MQEYLTLNKEVNKTIITYNVSSKKKETAPSHWEVLMQKWKLIRNLDPWQGHLHMWRKDRRLLPRSISLYSEQWKDVHSLGNYHLRVQLEFWTWSVSVNALNILYRVVSSSVDRASSYGRACSAPRCDAHPPDSIRHASSALRLCSSHNLCRASIPRSSPRSRTRIRLFLKVAVAQARIVASRDRSRNSPPISDHLS